MISTMEPRKSLSKGLLAATALLFLAVGTTLARKKREATEASAREAKTGGATGEFPGTTPIGCDEGVIRWIPIVVPLFAVFLLAVVSLIDAVVL
jgi:hypothetical protein